MLFDLHVAPDDKAKLLKWMQSPLDTFDCFSPEHSNLSYTLTSPPCQMVIPISSNQHIHEALIGVGDGNDDHREHLTTCFSPSIFSPITVVDDYNSRKAAMIANHKQIRALTSRSDDDGDDQDQADDNVDSLDPHNSLFMLVSFY